MTRLKKLSRVAGLLLAVLVATSALTVLVHATQTIVTPNAAIVGYNLAPGAISGTITPASNVPVLVMGVQDAVGYRGVGHVTMLHIPGSFLEWAGIESPSSATITSGFSGAAGVHIVYLDWAHTVDLQVRTPDSFVVHNGNSTVTMNGYVTLIW